jgi:hypothetical protein
MNRLLARALSLAAAALPVGFASIRAIQTGWDFRYFLIAFAGLIGATVAMAVRRGGTTRSGVFATTMAAFAAAALFSTVAAMAIGTRLGPGLLVVSASFAACFAAAVFFHLQAGAGNHGR